MAGASAKRGATFSAGLRARLSIAETVLVGAMLPLVFRRLGLDPAYASSPFVATFVDVTGILCYFAIAQAFLA